MRSYMFLVTLFICALTDIVTFRIKNLILIISAAGLLLCDLSGFSGGDTLTDLQAGLIIFLVLIPFYLSGLMSAGDIKLLMLSAMYAGLPSICMITAASIISSSAIVICMSFYRREPLTKIKFPFAFALLLGAFPFWFSIF